MNTTTKLFSKRIQQVPRSFIRDILQVATSPNIISFAGGLPNKKYFPLAEIKHCTQLVLNTQGNEALQYSSTEGLPKLREQIAAHYKKQGLQIRAEQILITTGSQQALDLIGKVFINKNDAVIIEKPAYLGAIQAFSMYEPKFVPTTLLNNGIDTTAFSQNIEEHNAKMAYLVSNFQNPTGISYSTEKRQEVAQIAINKNLLLIEDDPYGQIRFTNTARPSLFSYAPNNTVLLGTFSKSIAPGFRIGWLVAPSSEIYDKLVIAKQASDLHTDIFSQRIISTFLENYEIETHLDKIITAYHQQSLSMLDSIQKYMPLDVHTTQPQGGMFCWLELPQHISSMQLFKNAIQNNVAFVPGVPFYTNKQDSNTLRLNFSCAQPAEIMEGIKRIALCLEKQMVKSNSIKI